MSKSNKNTAATETDATKGEKPTPVAPRLDLTEGQKAEAHSAAKDFGLLGSNLTIQKTCVRFLHTEQTSGLAAMIAAEIGCADIFYEEHKGVTDENGVPVVYWTGKLPDLIYTKFERSFDGECTPLEAQALVYRAQRKALSGVAAMNIKAEAKNGKQEYKPRTVRAEKWIKAQGITNSLPVLMGAVSMCQYALVNGDVPAGIAALKSIGIHNTTLLADFRKALSQPGKQGKPRGQYETGKVVSDDNLSKAFANIEATAEAIKDGGRTTAIGENEVNRGLRGLITFLFGVSGTLNTDTRALLYRHGIYTEFMVPELPEDEEAAIETAKRLVEEQQDREKAATKRVTTRGAGEKKRITRKKGASKKQVA